MPSEKGSSSRARAPSWMYVLAAVFVVTYCFNRWQETFGPGPVGIQHVWPTLRVARVYPGLPAEQAGVRAGDIIEAVDGQVLRERPDWFAARTTFELGRPIDLQVRRGEEHLHVPLVITTPAWRAWDREDYLAISALGISRFMLLSLAIFVAFSRPDQLSARLAALLFAAMAVAEGYPPYGWGAMLRHLPAVVSVPVALATASWMLAPTAWLSFFAVFPRPSLTRLWQWALVLLPAVIVVPPVMAWAMAMIYAPERALGMPWRFVLSAVVVGFAQDMAGVALLVRNYRRAEDVNDRRRLRTILFAACVGLLAGLAFVQPYSPSLQLAGIMIFVVFPLGFAYAILRHRMFDIRVIIRQGLQYGLARRVLLWLVPAMGAILVADLLLHGDQPLLAVLRTRGWIYAAVGGLALLAHTRRERWLDALDGRFFRERYDAQRILREVVEEVRHAGNFERVAPLVVARIEAALHAEFASLAVREPGDPMYRTLASSPAGQASPSFAAESKLMALVRLLGKPLEVTLSESGWLKQQLPHEETEFLRQAHVDLLVPIAVAAERKEAVLALGMKRSEEPYSREDQDLLVAIASSLALLLERPVAPGRASDAFQECPRCGACYDLGAVSCAREGAALTPVFVPRLVSGRYRLERRLGRGGMGTVYEATDTALERRVAAKLIREDLVGSAEAAERFHREARAAAGFAHPNVVTVHDFGMSGGRAFLVMELLEGVSLREELRRQGRLSSARTREILRGVCAAVDAAHRRQLIHRDLKPENIFLARGESGESTKVLDFGLVKSLSSASQETADTSAGILVGTLRYMSPDQFRGENSAPAWDLWALGVVAYELLTGQHPFGTGSGPEMHAAVLGGRFTPVTVACPDAPAAWQEFFGRALALHAENRPPSAQAFFSELDQALRSTAG